jgi:rhodanese-related sulfurtransferase
VVAPCRFGARNPGKTTKAVIRWSTIYITNPNISQASIATALLYMMSVLRPPSSLLLRSSRTTFSRSLRTFPTISQASTDNRGTTFQPFRLRFYSSNAPSSKFYSFAEVIGPYTHSKYPTKWLQVQKLSQNPRSSLTLIDTREPHELQSTGTIPTSVNIPVQSSPDAFFLTPEEFEERFGFERPEKEDEVVFYCKAGVRSRAAAELAKQAGWKTVAEYPGSWMDWEKNSGAREGGNQ